MDDPRTWYRCKECNKNVEKIEDNHFFCDKCKTEKTREEVMIGRTVKPAKSGTPIAAPSSIYSDPFKHEPFSVLNYTVTDIGGYENE